MLGAGRAGTALADALSRNGVRIVGLHGRRAARRTALRVSTGPIPRSIGDADVVLVTVRDSQLDAAFGEVLGSPLKAGAVVLHASGSAEPLAVEELRSRGHPAGSFHPLLPLTEDVRGGDVLAGAWIGIDGDAVARDVATQLASILGARVMSIPSGEKASYHAAAVIASNFPCVLAFLARQLLARGGVPAAQASAAVISLMHASVENLRGRDPAAALTGPVVRGDADTVKAHVNAIAASGDEHMMSVYRALTLVAVDMVRREAGDNASLREIELAVRGG